MNRKVTELTSIIHGLCLPFAYPELFDCTDWHERITLLTKVAELLTLVASEYPILISTPNQDFKWKPSQDFYKTFLDLEFELETSIRTAFLDCNIDFDGFLPLIDYRNVSKGTVQEENVISMFKGVVSVEKLAISTCSLAICKYQMPVTVLLMFTDIIRDECLHLLSLSRLIGVHPMENAWITEKRQPAWNQVKSCSNLIEHIILEHCLFEGEGAVSANQAVKYGIQNNFPNAALEVVKRIATEETRHCTLGYQMAGTIVTNDQQRNKAVNTALKFLREIEPIESVESLKGYKQHTAVNILLDFSTSGDWVKAVNRINELALELVH